MYPVSYLDSILHGGKVWRGTWEVLERLKQSRSRVELHCSFQSAKKGNEKVELKPEFKRYANLDCYTTYVPVYEGSRKLKGSAFTNKREHLQHTEFEFISVFAYWRTNSHKNRVQIRPVSDFDHIIQCSCSRALLTKRRVWVCSVMIDRHLRSRKKINSIHTDR